MKRAASILLVFAVTAASARAWGAEGPPAPPVTPLPETGPAAQPEAPLPPVVRGVAIELGTGGLSAAHGGAVGLGFGSTRLAGGIAFDFRYASLTGPEQGSSTAELTESAGAVGPWLRGEMTRTRDGRVSLVAALDLQYGWQSSAAKLDTAVNRVEGTAHGVIFRVGPGIRFWATPWLALGYTAQLTYRQLSGPLPAFTQSTALGPSTYEFYDEWVGLLGRFTALALF